jgi:hypothetical protein
MAYWRKPRLNIVSSSWLPLYAVSIFLWVLIGLAVWQLARG